MPRASRQHSASADVLIEKKGVSEALEMEPELLCSYPPSPRSAYCCVQYGEVNGETGPGALGLRGGGGTCVDVSGSR